MKCNKCGEDKPETDYYPRNKVCKECYKKRVLAYQKNEGLEGKRVRCRRYANSEKGLVLSRVRVKRYSEKHPKKRRAKDALNYAVRSGKIKKMPCEICGEKKAHGHHDDYDKPLEVRWLCPIHHKQWHSAHGEALNAT
ncbi:hypothetical protein pEaSNUABM56_00093 [Erwinia phage pEa_SNUABM_56]|uniref:Uncharacterized protein n=1 Tax=Erwinia phage pEp_SNUABM_01 TaxID=2601643 RepID=A0A5J6DAI5_9CAUD|nr:endonuclease [Erwinia phage pEp_SNUABM_01]QEQ94892.1 hypothetical protein pEpSNUABM01_066 [Erwinia phage pEp_SNUABM_01]UYL85138.1 hypothetical protein pEaSNUABM56_00093 [Erwinia phage pEa_SNUABM_56]